MTQEKFRDTVFVLKDEMFRFARKLVISNDEAQDVVQDLMMKFWQKKDQLSNYENLKAFVMKSVKNECLNRLKHDKVKMNFAAMQLHQNNFYQPEVNNLKEEIIKLIAMLPEKQKMVIHLKDVEEYEIAEISKILEIEENAVRVNLMRARQKIKEQISKLFSYEQRSISG